MSKSKKQAASQPSLSLPTKPSDWYAKLLPEQKNAADFVISKIRNGGGVGLFSQQRTGKTYISLAVIEQLDLKRVLVVAPLTSIDLVWVPKLATLGRVVRQPQELTEAFCGALVMHYQAFAKIAPRIAKRLSASFDLIIIDESQGLKARASAQSRAARRFRNARRRLALSGTPIDECPADVWGQMRFIDHTVLSEDWLPFAEKFCYKGGFMNKKWIFNPRKMDEFLNVLNPYIYRLTVDFMNLKPVMLHPVPTQLLGAQELAYRQMEEHGILKLDGHVITGPLEITKKMKLQQITGGHILTDDGDTIPVGRAKQRKLKWLMKNIKPPVVVFCQFLHEIEDICDVITDATAGLASIAVLHGGVKDTKKEKARTNLVNDFQDGKYNVLVCQLRTGGVSIELTAARSLILYSINYSFIDFEQIVFRLRGLTQKNEVNIYLMYAENTVDEEKWDIVEGKKSTVWTIMSSLERN